MPLPEVISFRASLGFRAALTEAAHRDRCQLADWIRRTLEATLASEGIPIISTPLPDGQAHSSRAGAAQ